MRKLGMEASEELLITLGTPGMKVLNEALDELVAGIQREVITRSLPPNIADATAYMYGLRCKADGAKELVEKFRMQIRDFLAVSKEKQDG